jgi:ankyrin repeat protein
MAGPVEDLFAAAARGDAVTVQALLVNGADVNAEYSDGATALIVAAFNGKLDVVQALLAKGANVSARRKDGATALMGAAFNRHLDVVQVLLAAGANVNATADSGGTVLTEASRAAGNLAVVRALLANGADVNAKRNDGATALIVASFNGNADIALALLDKEADVNARQADGGTALMAASFNGHLDVVQALLRNGADADIVRSDGVTALTLASTNGHPDVAQTLKDASARVPKATATAQDRPRTPTGAHAQGSPLPLFDAFKAYCVDTNAQPDAIKQAVEAAGGTPRRPGSTLGPTPMTTAGWDISVSGHSLLVSAGTSMPPNGHGKLLNMSACSIQSFSNEDASVEAIRRWVGVAPDRVSSGLYLYTYKETGSRRSAVSKEEVARSMSDPDGRVWSLSVLPTNVMLSHYLATQKPEDLIAAALQGDAATAQALLAKGADVNARQSDGATALILAAFYGYSDIVRALLAKGADVNAKQSDGGTALMAASVNGRLAVVQALLANGADVDAKAGDGGTALTLASSNGHLEVAQVLKDAAAQTTAAAGRAEDSTDAAAKIVAVTHLRKGDTLREAGKLADAEREYDLAIMSYPDGESLYSARARVRYLLKNYPGAIQDFNVYLARRPSDTQALLLRSLAKSLSRPEDTVGACADLLAIVKLGTSLDSLGIRGTNKYCKWQQGWGGLGQ